MAALAEAKEQRVEALKQKQRGDEQASIAKAVNEFLRNNLLRQADVVEQAESGFVSEPDLTITPLVSWDAEQANQAYLIVEVAESSLAIDRGRKRRLYASCGVPEYWIVNLPERCIEVYTAPEGNAYACVERYEPGQAIRLGAFSDVEVRVSDVLR